MSILQQKGSRFSTTGIALRVSVARVNATAVCNIR